MIKGGPCDTRINDILPSPQQYPLEVARFPDFPKEFVYLPSLTADDKESTGDR